MPFPLERFLNQTVSYQQFLGVDNRDTPSYAGAVTLVARFVEEDREHYGKQEEIEQSRSKVWLLTKPVLRSLINGREVIETIVLVGVDGYSAGYEAVLR